ncbi:tetratricopeptide repeat protein [Hazenella sp. IB182353]|uniref:helix-turn-helix domain-containing protein n=1 Tax=Polycladospora coralii TaxID=2771432 RepID=UPI001747D05C|nr:helix-turn-helix transcriptional regulator [Polycladospora coralii]MBS7530796.1 tetratricopeptide repeat protein [Polycladospora coralii]
MTAHEVIHSPHLSPKQVRQVGNHLQRRRKQMGLSIENLAQTGEISAATLSNIDNGKSCVTVEKIELYCHLLDTTLVEALKEIEDKEKYFPRMMQKLRHIERLIHLQSPEHAYEQLSTLSFESHQPLAVARLYVQAKCDFFLGNQGNAQKGFQVCLQQIERHPELFNTNLIPLCYLHLGRHAYFKEKNLTKAVDYVERGLAKYIPSGERQGIHYILEISHVIYLEKLGLDNRAIQIVQQLQEEIGNIHHVETKLQVFALHILLLYKKKAYEEGRILALEAMEIARASNCPEQLLEIYTLLGAICKELKDFVYAEDYYQFALDLEAQIKSRHLLATSYMRLGELYTEIGRWDLSQSMLIKAEHISRETDEPFRHMEALILLGDYYLRQQKWSEAIPYYERVWEYEEKLYPEQQLPKIRIKLAFCYRSIGELAKYYAIIDKIFENGLELELNEFKGGTMMFNFHGDPPSD